MAARRGADRFFGGEGLRDLAADVRAKAGAWHRAERRKAAGEKGVKFPTLPDAFLYARSVSYAGIRPWEWQQADSRDMYLVKTLNAAWTEGYADAKEAEDTADRMKQEREAAQPQPRRRR